MSQLLMEKAGLGQIPEVPLPEGYSLRTFRDGDEGALARIYRESKLDKDTIEIVRRDILGDPCFKPGRVFIAEFEGQSVGTGSAWVADEEPGVGYLHMLGVLDEHRGKRLGLALTCAAMRYTRDEGLDAQRLLTDDWREAAIRLYLSLGYDPLIADQSHPARWETLARTLGQPEILTRMRRMPPPPPKSLFGRLRRFVGFGRLI